ncbi:hypothetical protein ABT133_02380, partial [Streptomyces sp. NPDC001835]|uniref:hypothetical protein n=1 Tax=Streptomyces sp. NPDC001835 TaxID=3154528 RepID=UPI00331CD0F6
MRSCRLGAFRWARDAGRAPGTRGRGERRAPGRPPRRTAYEGENRGCIPTKALLLAGEVADQARESAQFGVKATF